jgi:hypothetical protein
MPTGSASGVNVLDIDVSDDVDGFAALERLGPVPDTTQVRTPRGGLHVWFRHDPDRPLRCSAGKLAPGIDTRGDGGYVILPGSVRADGKAYTWVRTTDLAPAPPWIYGPQRDAYADAALRGEQERVKTARNGTRNTTLNRAAFSVGQLVGDGLSEDEAIVSLYRAAEANGSVADDGPHETMRTLRSGLEAGKANPRDAGRLGASGAPKPANDATPPPARTSRFYSAADLQGRDVPPREWLVQGLVPNRTVTLFGGDGGTGKSLLALQLAVSVATERQWIGRDVTPGRVIFMSAEDDEDELHRRLNDILIAEGRCYGDASGLTLRSLAGEDALLAVEGQMRLLETELFKELEARAEADAPALIVIDTLADVYPANENDRAKVRQFIAILRGLAIKRRCAVILLAHPSLTGLSNGTGLSGSTAWNNSVRSRLYLKRITDNDYEPDPDARILTTMKPDSGTLLPDLGSTAKAERVFLKLLALKSEQGVRLSASPGPTYAPAQLAKHPEAEGMTKRALATAMEKLLQSGRIAVAEHGRGESKRRHLVIAECSR